MKILFIILLVIVALIAALRMRRVLRDRTQDQPLSQADKSAPEFQAQPPGTSVLAEETDERPEVDAAALAAARASVSQEIPDEVLKDVLLDATPQQAAQLFAGVSQDVMAGAIGQQAQGVQIQGHAKAEDLASLNQLASAVDDLDIWSFADDNSKSA